MWAFIIWSFSIIQFNVLINYVEASVCSISLNSLKTNQPLLLNSNNKLTGNSAFLRPNSNGQILFNSGDTVLLSCPGSFISQPDKSVIFESLLLKCTNVGFMYNREIYDIHKSTCTNEIVIRSGRCGNYQRISIGYYLPDGRYIFLIEVCFDGYKKNAVYSKFEMSQNIGGCVTNFPRYHFDSQLFGIPQDVVDNLYTQVVQQQNINRQLGLPLASMQYIDPKNNYYLAKGHLTAKCDFIFGPQQKLTSYYINTAPQWQSMNLGNWKTLETSIRAFAYNKKKDFIVYTGTYGVASLPNHIGVDTELYLRVTRGVKEMPIPALFWKILYDPVSKRGLTFLVVNNPHRSTYVPICPNTCPGRNTPIPLNWRPNDQKLGFAYCCDLAEFIKVMPISIKL